MVLGPFGELQTDMALLTPQGTSKPAIRYSDMLAYIYIYMYMLIRSSYTFPTRCIIPRLHFVKPIPSYRSCTRDFPCGKESAMVLGGAVE